jgi:antitoxin component YwqK of YwqJK toxin-antitoxin module
MKQFITSVFILSAAALSAQSFELLPNSKDTINFIDQVGKKQGKWVLMGKHKPGPTSCYKPDQKIEEGAYKENRKTGSWTEYYCNGNKKSDIPFQNGRPDGYSVTFYENGNKKEEGDWKANKWVGNYKLYYENGVVQHDFKFNQAGKQEGVQTYQYENGQVAVQGTFSNGKEAGVIMEYYDNGEKKAMKTYANGQVDMASIKTFEQKNKTAKINDAEKYAPSKSLTDIKKEEIASVGVGTNKSGVATISGQHTLYNKNKQVSKDGIFKDNRLMEGKAYTYNENGLLERVSLYKDGIYVGDAPFEKDK